MHVTNDLNDNYLGSGLILTRAIEKYGRENFFKEILFIFDNRQEMIEKEAEIIDESIVNSAEYYNIALGGYGGAIVLKEDHPLYKEVCDKISNAAISRREQISETVKQLHKEKRCGMYGKKQTENQKKLVREALIGKKKSEDHKKNQYESLMKTLNDPNYVHPNSGKPKSKIKCHHCSREIDPGNFKRYHGDRCKMKFEDSE